MTSTAVPLLEGSVTVYYIGQVSRKGFRELLESGWDQRPPILVAG